ncbi:MAG TPA: SGNH/GDSL hydrolase family protein [Chthonomonadaceae bacterium]|nr:SGNH/GDSL hydrolase family protein [Chthonomonadaceae bacterium]
MRFLIACLLLLALCLPAHADPDTPERPPILKGVHRIVCLGDSITQGGEGPGGYAWLFRHYLNALYPQQNIEVLNAGISGHKSTDMLARFQRDVLDKKPDMVTISVGVNDVWHGFYDNHPLGDGPRGVPPDAYRKNVEEMITMAEQANVKVVVLSTTVIHEELDNRENAKIAGYNAALRDLAHKHKALFVDYQKPFQALINTYRKQTGARDNLLTVDGVHMNALGNKVMAYTLLSGLGITPEARAEVKGAVEQALTTGK